MGIAFIVGYMVCDSFTSNWQSLVFKQYSVGSITMMMCAQHDALTPFTHAIRSTSVAVRHGLPPRHAPLSSNPSVAPSVHRYANLFSSGFTALGLVVTWEIGDVVAYISANPAIMYHIVVMAICSARS